jgi:hypothetical protein
MCNDDLLVNALMIVWTVISCGILGGMIGYAVKVYRRNHRVGY